VRITYFADVRFPLERANGIQTMETCYALVKRGHSVDLIVRPDTHTPARDPFTYYGLAADSGLTVERAPVGGPATAKRLGYIAFALGRSIGTTRADVLVTRDLGVASAILRVPRSSRPPLVYESHGYAPDVAAASPPRQHRHHENCNDLRAAKRVCGRRPTAMSRSLQRSKRNWRENSARVLGRWR